METGLRTLLDKLQSGSPAERNAAEHYLQGLSADEVVSGLLPLLQDNSNAAVRLAASIVLRALLIGQNKVYELNEEPYERLKHALLESLLREQEPTVSRALSHLVGQLGELQDDLSEWPQLSPVLDSLLCSNVEHLRLAGLEIFKYTAELSVAQLTSNGFEPLQTLVERNLAFEGSAKVHISTITLCAVISPFLVGFDRLVLARTMPTLCTMCRLLAQGTTSDGSQEQLPEFLQALRLVLEANPRVLRYAGTEILSVLLSIVGEVNSEARVAVIEVLVSISESTPKALSRCHVQVRQASGATEMKSFPRALLEALFRTIIQFSGSGALDWNDNSLDISERGLLSMIDPDGNLECAAFALSRLGESSSFGSMIALPITISLASECLQQSHWKARFAGLLGLSYMIETCLLDFHSSPEQLVDQNHESLLQRQRESNWLEEARRTFYRFSAAEFHALVRFEAIRGLKVTNTLGGHQFTPALVEDMCRCLVGRMTEDPLPRVRTIAVEALQALFDVCDPELVIPALDNVLPALENSISCGLAFAQEAVLGALSALVKSRSMAQAMSPFYPHWRDLLGAMVESSMSGEVTSSSAFGGSLRVRALECLVTFMHCVSQHRPETREDCRKLVMFMKEKLPLIRQESTAGQREVTSSAGSEWVVRSWERACECLGEEFSDFLEHVVPQLVTVIQEDVLKQSRFEKDDTLELSQVMDVSFEEERDKVAILSALCFFLRTLPVGILPWTKQISQVLSSVVREAQQSELRIIAAAGLPDLLPPLAHAASCGSVSRREALDAAEHVEGILLQQLGAEESLNVAEALVLGIRACEEFISSMKPVDERRQRRQVGLEMVCHGLWSRLQKSIQNREILRAQLVLECGKEGTDEDAQASLEEGDQEEENLRFQIVESLCGIARCHGDGEDFLEAFVSLLLNHVLDLAHPSRLFQDRVLALYLLDQVLASYGTSESSREMLMPFTATLLRAFLSNARESVDFEQNDILQGAMFGLGVLAKQMGSTLKQAQVEEVLAVITGILETTRSNQDLAVDLRQALENGKIALGKIVRFCPSVVDKPSRSSACFVWLQSFPFPNDPSELEDALDDLLYLLSCNDGVLQLCLTEVVRAMCSVLLVQELSSPLRARVIEVLSKVAQENGSSWKSAFATFPSASQNTILHTLSTHKPLQSL